MTARCVGRLAQIWKILSPQATAPAILRGVGHDLVRTRSYDFCKGEPFRRLQIIAQHCEKSGGPSLHRKQLSTSSDTQVCGEEWPEHEFSDVAEASLESISDQVSDIGFVSKNAPEDFDIELSQGVLTISLGSAGTYVLNTQTPNRQIWMSSPSSGPWRYAWNPQQKAWISTRDGHMLNDRLTEELTDVFKEAVLISFKDVSAA